MGLGIKQHARIWTQEISLCALKKVPFVGPAADVARTVRLRYEAARMDNRLSAVEAEIIESEIRMRDCAEQAVRDTMESLRQSYLDGPSLTQLVKEYKSINEAGYNSALFEGLFLGTSHYKALKEMPQNYGSVVDPGVAMEPGHFPIIIELDGQDRILAVPPAALAQILAGAAGQEKASVITSGDVFAIQDKAYGVGHDQFSVSERNTPAFHTHSSLQLHGADYYIERAEKALNTLGCDIEKDGSQLGTAFSARDVSFQLHMVSGSCEKVIADCTEALQLEPESARSYRLRGKAQYLNNDSDAAISDFTVAIRLEPGHTCNYYLRARALLSTPDGKNVLRDVTRSDSYLFNGLGGRRNNYQDVSVLEALISDYTEILRLEPSSARSYVSRGNVLESKGDYGEAISDYSEAVRLEPENTHYYYLRARAFISTLDFKIVSTRAATADGDQQISVTRKSDNDIKVLQAVISDFTEMLRLDPDNAQSYFLRGEARKSLHDYVEAISDFSKAIQLEPSRADFYKNKAELLVLVNSTRIGEINEKQLDTAISALTEALRLEPEDAEAYASRGRARQLKNDNGEAISDFTESLRLDYDVEMCLLFRAESFFRNGDYHLAISDYTEVLRVHPGHAHAERCKKHLEKQIKSKQYLKSKTTAFIKSIGKHWI